MNKLRWTWYRKQETGHGDIKTGWKLQCPFWVNSAKGSHTHCQDVKTRLWAVTYKTYNWKWGRMIIPRSVSSSFVLWWFISLSLSLKQSTRLIIYFLSLVILRGVVANKLVLVYQQTCFICSSLFLTARLQWRFDWNLRCSATLIYPLELQCYMCVCGAMVQQTFIENHSGRSVFLML